MNTLMGEAMTNSQEQSDNQILLRLNNEYIHSVQNGDVQRFEQLLANDFRCSNPDGSLIDRNEFLDQTSKSVTIKNLQALDVEIRLMGDFAIIHARTSYVDALGSQRSGRYTDTWARRNGLWLAVSAHVTRG